MSILMNVYWFVRIRPVKNIFFYCFSKYPGQACLGYWIKHFNIKNDVEIETTIIMIIMIT